MKISELQGELKVETKLNVEIEDSEAFVSSVIFYKKKTDICSLNMQINLTFVTGFLIVAIAQSVFAAAMLFLSRDNRSSNRLLSVLILLLALWLTDHFMRIAGIYNQDPQLYFLPLFYSLAFGPLIWCYVRSLVNAAFHLGRKDLWHFIPVMIQAALYWSLTFLPYRTKYWFWEHVHKPYTYRLEFDATWLSLIIYLILAFRLVKRYQAWLRDNYSETSRIRLNWLKVLLLALIVVCVQWLAEVILRDGLGIYFQYDFSVQLLALLMILLAVAGHSQPSLGKIVYQSQPKEETSLPFQTDPEILVRLVAAMEQDRLYLNPTLDLNELSAALKLSPRVVSRHINTGMGVSFSDYVNGYRVKEVKRRIRQGDLEKLTLLAIALESGFNSKTSFNRVFKDMEGMAPSEFRE